MEDLIKWLTRLQRQVDGLVKPETGRWISWTPTVTQGVAVGVTVSYARYFVQPDDLVIVNARLEITSAGTGGSFIVIGNIPTVIAPVQADNFTTIGSGFIYDNPTILYVGSLVDVTTTDWRFVISNANNYAGADPNFALANTDKITFIATYERA